MAKNELRKIKGKLGAMPVAGREVWFAESHHMVLEAWAKYRISVDRPPHLITLDRHSDLRKAFTRDCCDRVEDWHIPTPEECYAHMAPLVAKLSTLAADAVRSMIDRLTFEEHIDAAQRAGVIDAAFLCLSERPGIDPEPALRQFAVWTDTWDKKKADKVLEPDILGKLIELMESRTESPIEETDYILDIDLDYFRTAKAIRPDDPAPFQRLVRHAGLITVALEPECVMDGRHDGEGINAQSLFADLAAQIELAN